MVFSVEKFYFLVGNGATTVYRTDQLINPYPTSIFVLLFTSATNTQMHFRLDFIIETNTMNADQTAPFV